MNDVDFVADNHDGNAQVNFENTLTKGHIHAHIHVLCAHVTVQVVDVPAWGRFEFFFARDYQVSIVVDLGLLVGLHYALNLLFHLFVFSDFHIGKNREKGLAQG